MKTEEEILQGMDYVSFLTRCKVDFKFFCERLLEITEYGGIHKFQMDWFYLIQNSKVSVIEAAAGHSKTEIVGVAYTLYYVLNHPNSKVLLISKAMKQAETNLLERIKNYIHLNEITKKLFKPEKETTWNKTQIKLADGSLITNVPYNINVRSYRANLIICDEADTYDDPDLYFSEVTSRLIPGGKICLISTPNGVTKLIGQLKARRPTGYQFLVTPALVDLDGNRAKPPYEKDKIRSIWEERFSVDYLLTEREAIGDTAFELVYQCNVIEGEDAIFSIKTITECFDETIGFDYTVNEKAQYFISADFATSKGPKADYDAFVVIEKLGEYITIKHIEIWKGKLVPFKEKRLLGLYDIFQNGRTVKLIIDPNNVGEEVARRLRSYGCTTIFQKFDHQSRKGLLTTLSNVFESRTIRIPRSPSDDKALKLTDLLIEQAIGFKRKKSESGNEVFLSTAPHDDILMSLAMAINHACKVRSASLVGMSK